MKRLARVAAGALAAAVMTTALTATGAGAYAAAEHGHRAHHAAVEQDGSPRVLMALGRLDHRLDGALRHRLAPLSATDATILRSNWVADRSAVQHAANRYSVAPTRRHLAAARTLLRSFHPRRYVAASAILRRASTTAESIRALSSLVPADTLAASELTTATTLLSAIRVRHFTARCDSSEMRRAREEVKAARALVARVRAELALAR